MESPQALSAQLDWPAVRGRVAASARKPPGNVRQPHAAHPGPWGVIWRVGGLCWLIVTATALLWMLPESEATPRALELITTQALVLQHVLVFLAAAVGYRAAIAVGWPDGVWGRVRAAAANTLLALTVVALSPLALSLATGILGQPAISTAVRLTGSGWLIAHWQSWAVPLRFFLPPYVLGLCAIALVLLAHRRHGEALRAAELASAYSAARMAMLSAQLQPHFLFNSLHAISVLIDDNPRQASAMLARLGDFLRHVIESSHWPWVDVETELAGLGAYLAVQQTRFSDRLSIAIDPSAESLGVYVPSLLLQPLAENAIEHGRNDGSPTLAVCVTAVLRGERLRIAVSNSSPQLSRELSPGDYGHGLRNVELRLRAAYGSDARLTIGPAADGGTSAVLDLPVRLAPASSPAGAA
jgi:Histidine kinase